mmetsp:Transcript_25231/g.51258  ORF Transcript_25231/g.51258 Transcript_25231/m.51258 type:complete len:288 (-) Transcript_25231:13-876(-)
MTSTLQGGNVRNAAGIISCRLLLISQLLFAEMTFEHGVLAPQPLHLARCVACTRAHRTHLRGHLPKVHAAVLHVLRHLLRLRLEGRVSHHLLHLAHRVRVLHHLPDATHQRGVAHRVLQVGHAELGVVQLAGTVARDILRLPLARLAQLGRTARAARAARAAQSHLRHQRSHVILHRLAVGIEQTAVLRLGLQLRKLRLGRRHVLGVLEHLLRLGRHLGVLERCHNLSHLVWILAQLLPARHCQIHVTLSTTTNTVCPDIAASHLRRCWRHQQGKREEQPRAHCPHF